jgi:hypothetical protein
MSDVVLIPGLKVDVDGMSDGQGWVVAKTITVDGDDLETAEMIEGGTSHRRASRGQRADARGSPRAARGTRCATRVAQGEHRNQPAEYRGPPKIEQKIKDIAIFANHQLAQESSECRAAAARFSMAGVRAQGKPHAHFLRVHQESR